MMLKELHQYCVEIIELYPHHEMAIRNFYDLAVMEVEDGGSEAHKCELAMRNIVDLISQK